MSLLSSLSSSFRLRIPFIASTANRLQSTSSVSERSFIMVKPDGVQRGLVGKIISRFEQRGYTLVAMKMVKPPREHLEEHYSHLRSAPFFPAHIDYMSAAPVVAMVWQGGDAVNQGRSMLGATNPCKAPPGTIRGDYAVEAGRNIVHGSDSREAAEREIAHWFKPSEICDRASPVAAWLYE